MKASSRALHCAAQTDADDLDRRGGAGDRHRHQAHAVIAERHARYRALDTVAPAAADHAADHVVGMAAVTDPRFDSGGLEQAEEVFARIGDIQENQWLFRDLLQAQRLPCREWMIFCQENTRRQLGENLIFECLRF